MSCRKDVMEKDKNEHLMNCRKLLLAAKAKIQAFNKASTEKKQIPLFSHQLISDDA